MEVSANLIQGLSAAGNTNAVPDDCFHPLVESACQGILTKSHNIGIYFSLHSSRYASSFNIVDNVSLL